MVLNLLKWNLIIFQYFIDIKDYKYVVYVNIREYVQEFKGEDINY